MELVKRLALTGVFCALIHLGTPSQIQKQNTSNLILAKQPGDNLGLFWYLMAEMFEERIPFFRYALQCCSFQCASSRPFSSEILLTFLAGGGARPS